MTFDILFIKIYKIQWHSCFGFSNILCSGGTKFTHCHRERSVTKIWVKPARGSIPNAHPMFEVSQSVRCSSVSNAAFRPNKINRQQVLAPVQAGNHLGPWWDLILYYYLHRITEFITEKNVFSEWRHGQLPGVLCTWEAIWGEIEEEDSGTGMLCIKSQSWVWTTCWMLAANILNN